MAEEQRTSKNDARSAKPGSSSTTSRGGVRQFLERRRNARPIGSPDIRFPDGAGKDTRPRSILFEYRIATCAILIGVILLGAQLLTSSHVSIAAVVNAWLFGVSVDEGGLTPEASRALFWSIVRELGMTLLIGGIIALSVEKVTRDRDSARARHLRREVATDAVYALYGLFHDKTFIKSIVESNFEAKVVREDTHLNYFVRDLRMDEAKDISRDSPRAALERFVILEMKTKFTLRNTSAHQQPVDIEYLLPRRLGEALRRLTRVNFVQIDGSKLKDSEIERSEVESVAELRYAWSRCLKGGATLLVEIGATCIKERSDNEVWSSIFPTMGTTLLTLSVPGLMNFGVRAITNSPMIEEPSFEGASTKSWRIHGPLLRFNSLVFWWRTPEDDATGQKSGPIDFAPAETAPSSDLIEPGLSGPNRTS